MYRDWVKKIIIYLLFFFVYNVLWKYNNMKILKINGEWIIIDKKNRGWVSIEVYVLVECGGLKKGI